MSSNKAPSAGNKVTYGENAPVRTEGAGAVAPESLAAESYSHGGAFHENAGGAPNPEFQGRKVGQPAAAQRSATDSQQPYGQADTSPSSDQGGPAPTYVNAQLRRDPAGPHGKNLHEGGFSGGDGVAAAFNAEPGSRDDPSRLAEQQFLQNQNAAGRDAGPRQHRADEQQPYGALDAETES